MRIFIDLRSIGASDIGVKIYLRQLISRLLALEPSWNWSMLISDKSNKNLLLSDLGLSSFDDKISVEIFNRGVGAMRGYFSLPSYLRLKGCDLFFIPDLTPGSVSTLEAVGGTCPRIAVLRKLENLDLGNSCVGKVHKFVARFVRYQLRQTIRQCSAVIVDNNAAKKRLSMALNMSASQTETIHAVYDGMDEMFTPHSVNAEKQSSVKTILYVGRIAKDRNISTLIRAFSELRHDLDMPVHLLIVGTHDASCRKSRELVRRLKIIEDVTFVNTMTLSEQRAVCREASVFVDPAGFDDSCVPMLMAIGCGTPVICCGGVAQREFVGTAALTVPPRDAQALEDAMRKVLCDDAVRQLMIDEGLRRTSEFTWNRTAADTLSVIRGVLGSAEEVK